MPLKNMSEKQEEEQHRLFDLDLSQNVLQGNTDIVESHVKSDFFKWNYKDRWIFKCFPCKCERPESIYNIYTYSPMIAAVGSESLDMVKLIAETNPNVYIEEDFGSCALTLAIERGKRDIFKYIATRYFTDYKDPVYCGKVLLILLFKKWLEEFEFFKFVTGVDIYTFFHSHHRLLPLRYILQANFPLHCLCEHSISESIAYLLDNYDRDILNFDGHSDMKIEPFSNQTKPEIKYQYSRKPDNYDLRQSATCTEQLLPLSMYHCAEDLYNTDIEIEDRKKIIKLILNSNHLSENAIFCKDTTKNYGIETQWGYPILLDCALTCEDEDIYMKVEQLIINVMGKEEAYTFLLNHILCILPKMVWRKREIRHSREDLNKKDRIDLKFNRRDLKKVDRYVKEGGDWSKMAIQPRDRSFIFYDRTIIADLICDVDLVETVSWIYREGNLVNTNSFSHVIFCKKCDNFPKDKIKYESLDFCSHPCICTLLDKLLHVYLSLMNNYRDYGGEKKYKVICVKKLKNAAKAILILYAAGEDFSMPGKQNSDLIKLDRLNEFKNITYDICPYTGPLIDDWAELLSDNWHEKYGIKCNTDLNIKDPVIFDAVRKAKICYQPTLQEIARKQIRDTLKINFKN